MFTVYMGSILTTGLFVQAVVGTGEANAWFILAISAWLWFTVLFANFAEAMAEGRGKAQADSLRKARREITAKKLAEPHRGAAVEQVNATTLRKGREKQHYLNPVPINEIAERWIGKFERGRLAALSELKKRLEREEP